MVWNHGTPAVHPRYLPDTMRGMEKDADANPRGQDVSPEVRLAELVMPNRTNHLGTLFGGHALGRWTMPAGWRRRASRDRTMVTVASDRVEFKVPVRAGQLVELVARITRVGRTSVTVGVDMYAEGSRAASGGWRRRAASSSSPSTTTATRCPSRVAATDVLAFRLVGKARRRSQRRGPGAWTAPLSIPRRTPRRARCRRGVHLEGGWLRQSPRLTARREWTLAPRGATSSDVPARREGRTMFRGG